MRLLVALALFEKIVNRDGSYTNSIYEVNELPTNT